MTYTELVNEIENAPVTWLPGLFVKTVDACRRRKVFRSELTLVEAAIKVVNSSAEELQHLSHDDDV